MSALTVTVSAEDGAEVAQKTVRFQCGLFRETETFTGDDLAVLCRDTILDFACFMLAERVSAFVVGTIIILYYNVQGLPVLVVCMCV